MVPDIYDHVYADPSASGPPEELLWEELSEGVSE